MICDEKGSEYFKKKFSDNEFKIFFSKFYGTKKHLILTEFLNDKEFILLKCKKCKFIWQKFQPTNELAIKLYDTIIDDQASLKKSENIYLKRKEKFKQEFDYIYKYFNFERINVLDFGAGWGSWLKSIDTNKVNSYALEISISRKKYLISKKIKVLDLNQVKNHINYFNFIKLEQVLEHLTDLKSSMELLKRIANKNSIIDVSVPNGNKEINKSRNIKIEKGPIQPLEHVNCFTNRSLKKLFSNYGFKPLSTIDLTEIYLDKSLKKKFNFKMYIKNIYENLFSTSIKFKLK